MDTMFLNDSLKSKWARKLARNVVKKWMNSPTSTGNIYLGSFIKEAILKSYELGFSNGEQNEKHNSRSN